MSARRAKRDQGAALIAAMLVAALAAAVAAALASAQSHWLRTVELRREQVQAQAMVQAGFQWARQAIHDDARLGPYDHLGEPWAMPLPPTPLDNGSVEGAIVDAQGRLNVNNLGEDGIVAATERSRFERLFRSVGAPRQAVEAIAQRIADLQRQWAPSGESSRPGATRADPPFLRAAEIAEVRPMSDASYLVLSPYVVALPARTALNVNTAPPEVLAAAVPELEGDALAAFVAARAKKFFTTVAEFRARLPQGAKPPDERTLSVASDYFLVTVLARQGETIARGRALLRRQPDRWPAVVWQTIE